MSDRPASARLRIGEGQHQAIVDVDEHGTEAAAATAVGVALGAAPWAEPPLVPFRADHPFLFLIRDTKSLAILFLGRLVNPQQPL